MYFIRLPFIAVKERDPRANVLGSLKLFGNLFVGERIINPIAAVPQLLNLLECIAAALFLGDNNVDVDLILIFGGGFQFLARRGTIANEFAEHGVAHRKTERGHRDRVVTELADQIVVAAAASDRAQFPGAIEHFENGSGVIGKPAHNSNIDINETSKPTRAKSIDKAIQLPAAAALIENRKDRSGQFAELLFRFLARLTAGLIDDLQHFLPALRRKFLLPQKVGPKFAVADPNNEIVFSQPKSAQDVDAKRD